jgi:hypothetical protein
MNTLTGEIEEKSVIDMYFCLSFVLFFLLRILTLFMKVYLSMLFSCLGVSKFG